MTLKNLIACSAFHGWKYDLFVMIHGLGWVGDWRLDGRLEIEHGTSSNGGQYTYQ